MYNHYIIPFIIKTFNKMQVSFSTMFWTPRLTVVEFKWQMQNKSSPQTLSAELKIQAKMLHRCIDSCDITLPTKQSLVKIYDLLHSVTNGGAVLKHHQFSRSIYLLLPLTDLKTISLNIINSGMMPQLQDFHWVIPIHTEQELYCNAWQDINTWPCFHYQPLLFLL
jgi:hypothetical protein